MRVARLSAALAASASVLVFASAAYAQTSRAVLPIPQPPFAGKITEDVRTSEPAARQVVRAPANAPNILLFMSDDVGFAMSSAFGGPVPTPNFDRLASRGQRYNRFHTTAICSATRASLLTGRNHHRVGTGYVSDVPNAFPGYDAYIPPSAATIAQTLRLNGYNTAMFGKHHNVPAGEDTAAGPFDMWPTGLGFEYFFGFLGGDTDQWSPNLFRGVSRVPPENGSRALLERRLADDAITWIHNQKAAAPDKPFFIYYAPGTLHAPQQAPPEYIARFKGKFDQGWDALREETYRRQLAAGVIPPGTVLTPRPDGVPAWSSLNAQQRAFATRAMEVAAAALAYQDDQLGRVLNELERMGVLDDTLVLAILGDNGAEAGSGAKGTINEIGLVNGIEESDAWLAANADKLGGPQTYGQYPAGWAWAMNTPLRWAKQYASMLGGVRNGMIVSWAGRVAKPNSVCGEFGHVVDVAPTLLEAAQIPAPEVVYGEKQMPFDGKSLVPSLSACEPDRPRTQYFEMVGKVGLYHDGWFAARDDGRKPWESRPPEGGVEGAKWALYDLRRDFSQANDVSEQEQDRLAGMVELWRQQARENQVYPLDHRFAGARGGTGARQRTRYEFWGKDVSLPANREPLFAGRSFTLTAELELNRPQASGAVAALGSHFGGWSVYLDQGRPAFVHARSTAPEDITKVVGERRLPAGAVSLRMTLTSEGVGKGARVELADGKGVVATASIPRTFLTPAGLGETLDFGRDLGVPVTDYGANGAELQGDVKRVVIEFAQ